MNYYLVKSEPEDYSLADLKGDGKAMWDGVRGFAAMRNMKTMRRGDQVLYYHTGKEKAVVGLASVVKEHYHDPAAPENEPWCCVDLKYERTLERPVTLKEVKAHPTLKESLLARQSRLSVMPFTREEFDLVLELSRG
ncbi:MAG: EVE domain-containing protein [Spirochaetales bacterium]|nr:EVE domain-containing protein [Spirochaetales bacterium]